MATSSSDNAERLEERPETLNDSQATKNSTLSRSNLHVYVEIVANIPQFPTDGIVRFVDEKLRPKAGASQDITEAAGKEVVKELEQRLRHTGPAGVTDVVVTSGGKLSVKKVLHAVGPSRKDYRRQVLYNQQLTATIFNCLEEASKLGLSTLAVPLIQSVSVFTGSRRTKREVCATSYKAGLEKFKSSSGPTTLCRVFFVTSKEKMTAEIQKALPQHTDVQSADNELRIVLVGGMGVGKSSLGNSILGGLDAFQAARGFMSKTQTARLDTMSHEGFLLQVVDTPGLLESDPEREELMRLEIVKSLTLLLPGPHVILIVFRADQRFTKAEVTICEEVGKLFNDFSKHSIIVFTHVDDETNLGRQIERAPQGMKDLLEKCGNRLAAIDNDSAFDVRKDHVSRLVRKIVELRSANGGRHYSNEFIDKCRHIILTGEMAGKTFGEIREEVRKGEEVAVNRVLHHPQTKPLIDRLYGKCTIL